MREKLRDKSRILDIIAYSKNVIEFVKGSTYEKFVKDKLLFYAVMKNVEIVGEAAYMLSKDFKQEHAETPWDMVQGMRHVLVHDYARINSNRLWSTAVNDIPVICQQAENYLAQIDWEKWENE